MKVLSFTRLAAQAEIASPVTGARARKQAQVMGALAGLIGSVMAGLFGAVFTAASWFVINEGARRWFSITGTILLSMTVPLMIFGGYCMDWMEKGMPRRHPKFARYEH